MHTAFHLLLALSILLCCGNAADTENKGRVVVLLEPGCPIARYHLATLRACHDSFAPKGIHFEGYVPNSLATAQTVAAYRKKFQIPFPITADPRQQKAGELGATVVPEVFVYDANDTLVYRGRIDDTYAAIGKRRPQAQSHELKQALDALVHGSPVSVSQTTPVGCAITFTSQKTKP